MNLEEKDPVFIQNEKVELNKLTDDLLNGLWVRQNTAILIIHGIGHQVPLETLDKFVRRLCETYHLSTKETLKIEHKIVNRLNEGSSWFENFIRIQKPGSDFYIDVYEYYWAHLTEDQATINEIQKWLRRTVKGAGKFYKRNSRFGQMNGDNSFFFNRTGDFNLMRYRFFLFITAIVIPGITTITNMLLGLIGRIQIMGIGHLFSVLKEGLSKSKFGMVTNVIGDITIYNTSDAKSKFYKIRRDILKGAVSALQLLLEPDGEMQMKYGKIVLAGHSLGSQVAFDAINRINVMVNGERILGYNKDGYYEIGNNNIHISKVLCGFVTFGSPLDKIAFFLREHVPDEAYIRLQLLNNYHGFKQRDWTAGALNNVKFVIPNPIKRHFDTIKWRNYYDTKDYVSGGLDYYHPLTNVNCGFQSNFFSFTHSNYWDSKEMFSDMMKEIIFN